MQGLLGNRFVVSMGPGVLVTGRLSLLLMPTALLFMATLRQPSGGNLMLWLGTSFQLVVCLLTFMSRGSWSQPIGPSVITLYLIALAWLWFADGHDDWYTHLAQAILLVVPLAFFGLQTLSDSGAPALRRATLLANRLAARKEWPADLTACRSLPEVKALRAALGYDAVPALALLHHERPEVRVAALAALEFRKEWRTGQAEIVLQVARRAVEPVVRAAAVTALGNLEDRDLVESLAQFLHDVSPEVRQAAAEALLWDTEKSWGWIRHAVRRYLADPVFFSDGPLTHNGQPLTPEAVKDLTAWSAEKGLLSSRSAQTLGFHYHRALTELPDANLVQSLRDQLADPHTPVVLRLELGRVLQTHQELAGSLVQTLLDPANPAPLRLIACETILSDASIQGAERAGAEAALRDLARLPNREISLNTADIVQRRLGVDLGMGLGQPLPPVHSRQAADISRRVTHWANQAVAVDELENSRLPAAS